ncbi:ComF family protein [Candidatus Falkowbacteria bacterium]|nr:ComF family protein [Candidatus Falkowbacteria bacterium]
MKISVAAQWLWEVLFPTYCLGCRRPGQYFCADCWQSLSSAPAFGSDSGPEWERVQIDARPVYLDSVIALADYGTPLVRQAVHYFKYRFVLALGQELMVALVSRQPHCPWPGALLVPIPLHRKKLKRRGFNQAAILAQAVGLQWQLPVCTTALYRCRQQVAQMTLNRQQRLENIHNIFAVQPGQLPAGGTIVLVDDVVTTGATLNEAARVLKTAGARRVVAVVLAHEKTALGNIEFKNIL